MSDRVKIFIFLAAAIAGIVVAIWTIFFSGLTPTPPPTPKTGDTNIEANPTVNLQVTPTIQIPSPIPDQGAVFTLPSGTDKVIGREEEITRAVTFLKEGKDVLIHGIPGMMQRETALAAARRIRKADVFTAGVLFHEVGEGKNTIDVMDANDHRESFSLYQAEIDNIRGIRKWAWEGEKWQGVSDLVYYCYRYLQSIGRWEEAVEWGHEAIRAAEGTRDKKELANNFHHPGPDLPCDGQPGKGPGMDNQGKGYC